MPFTKRALGFFRGLARHNEKAWFEAHQDEYETEVRQPMRDLIEDLDTRFAEFAPEIGGDPKRSMFRINRARSTTTCGVGSSASLKALLFYHEDTKITKNTKLLGISPRRSSCASCVFVTS